MAKSRNLASLVSDIATCSICLELCRKPKSLPCRHSFCLECLEGHCRDQLPGDEVACPLCREDFVIPQNGVDGLVNDFMLESLMDARKLATSEYHNRCDKHPNKPVELYCFTCKKDICLVCSALDHEGHKRDETKKVADDFVKKIDLKNAAQIEDVRVLIEKLSSKSCTLSDDVRNAEMEIKQKAEEIKQQVDRKVNSLLQELDSIKNEAETEAEACQQKLHVTLTELESFNAEWMKCKSKGKPSEIILAQEALHSIETNISIGHVVSQVNFLPNVVSLDEMKLGQLKTATASVDSRIFTLKQDDLNLEDKLGSGMFGDVMSGIYTNRRTGKTMKVAVKVLDLAVTQHAESMEQAAIMAKLENEHIITLIGVCQTNTSVLLVMELAPFRSLRAYLRRIRPPMNQVLELMLQVAMGMKYLDSKNYVHRNLAARNVLLVGEYRAKIGAFGMCKAMESHDESHDMYYMAEAPGQWPIKWYAPESIYFLKFSPKSDIWSYGITLWEATSFGDKPYKGLRGSEIITLIAEDGKRLDKPPECPDGVYEIMHRCWQRLPENRPTFSQLIDLILSLDDCRTTQPSTVTCDTVTCPVAAICQDAPDQMTTLKSFRPGWHLGWRKLNPLGKTNKTTRND